MAKYIDKSALVAEIDIRIYRRKKEYNILEEPEIWEDALKLKERINELVDLRTQILFNTLDTLEVKEVGLDLGSPDGDMGVKTVWDGDKIVSSKTQKGE